MAAGYYWGQSPLNRAVFFLPLVEKKRSPLAGSTYPMRRRMGPLLAPGRLRGARLLARKNSNYHPAKYKLKWFRYNQTRHG